MKVEEVLIISKEEKRTLDAAVEVITNMCYELEKHTHKYELQCIDCPFSNFCKGDKVADLSEFEAYYGIKILPEQDE